MVRRIRPVRTTLIALIALSVQALAVGWAPCAAGAATGGAAEVVVPPDLQALEQKMLAMQLTSERIAASLSVSETSSPTGLGGGFGHVFGKSSAVAASLLTISGEVNFAPQAAKIETSFFGRHLNARLLGDTLYLEEPELVRLDGGRPWVALPNRRVGSVVGVGPAANAEGGLEPAASFKGLVETIARAQSIQEVGPATVDGQATTEFKLAIPFEALGKLPRAQARLLHRLFAPLVSVELFIAEDGLPLRTRVGFRLRPKRGELIAQSDVLAVNIPVFVEAPPAAETITDGELRQLLRRRLASAKRRESPRHERLAPHGKRGEGHGRTGPRKSK